MKEGKASEYTEAVVGYVLIKRWYATKSRRAKCYIDVEPISINWEGVPSSQGLELDEDDEILGFLPATRRANLVFGEGEDEESLEPLGYDFEGAYTPVDWYHKTRATAEQPKTIPKRILKTNQETE